MLFLFKANPFWFWLRQYRGCVSNLAFDYFRELKTPGIKKQASFRRDSRPEDGWVRLTAHVASGLKSRQGNLCISFIPCRKHDSRPS